MSPVYFYIVPTIILLVGVINDIRSKKVHNWLTLGLMAAALVYVGLIGGIQALFVALISGTLALTLTLPFVMGKIMGGGDMKILIAFGFATDMTAVFYVFLYSFIWGALLGLIKAFLDGQALDLLRNTVLVAQRNGPATEKLHRIPYTVALLFGWLTHLSLQGVGL